MTRRQVPRHFRRRRLARPHRVVLLRTAGVRVAARHQARADTLGHCPLRRLLAQRRQHPLPAVQAPQAAPGREAHRRIMPFPHHLRTGEIQRTLLAQWASPSSSWTGRRAPSTSSRGPREAYFVTSSENKIDEGATSQAGEADNTPHLLPVRTTCRRSCTPN
jgi:hypothetical protein